MAELFLMCHINNSFRQKNLTKKNKQLQLIMQQKELTVTDF